MNHPWAEVNAAVLAVLAGWNRPARGVGNRVPSRNGPLSAEVYADRLLGVRQAEGMLDRGEVRILPGTVVTPMARDLLKRQSILVRVVSASEAALTRSRNLGEWGFAIESRRHPGLTEALRRHWLDAAWLDLGDGVEAAGWVVKDEGRGALVVADEASVATWRANRVDGVRAATVADVEATVRAVRYLGANLLVVEPATRSIHLIRQIAGRFRDGGAPSAPDWSDQP